MQNPNPSSLAPEMVPLSPELTASPAKGVDERGEGGACDGRAALWRGLKEEEEKEARTKQVCNDSRRHDAKEKTSRAGKEQRELGTQLLGPKGLTTHTRQVRTADTAGAMHGASKRPG